MAAESVKLDRTLRLSGANSAVLQFFERMHLTVSGIVLMGLGIVSWLIARWLGSRALFLMVYGGLMLLVVSYVIARRRLAIDVDRSEIPARMREGQVANVTLKIQAQRRATTLILEEQLHPALGRSVRVPVASIGSGEEIEHEYSFSPRRRGVYDIGPATATWSDPFGLTVQSQTLSDTTKIIVHPSTELVHDRLLTRMWEDPPVRAPTSKPWPTGFEFYGMRDYVQGDDLRRVVWSAVAKTGRMLVRESEQGVTDRVSIVLDTNREWHKPGDPSDTFEAGVRVAASLGAKHIKDGYSVNLSTNEVRLSEGLRGPRARYAFLDELAKVGMSRAPLEASAPVLQEDARHGVHFSIITPHLDKNMTTHLRQVLEKGVSILIVKLVWDESDPLSLARAASLGCSVVQVPVDSSIEAAFTHQIGAGMRR